MVEVLNRYKPGITKEQMWHLFQLAEERTERGFHVSYQKECVGNNVKFFVYNGDSYKCKKYYAIECHIGEHTEDYYKMDNWYRYVPYAAVEEILKADKVTPNWIKKVIEKHDTIRYHILVTVLGGEDGL